MGEKTNQILSRNFPFGLGFGLGFGRFGLGFGLGFNLLEVDADHINNSILNQKMLHVSATLVIYSWCFSGLSKRTDIKSEKNIFRFFGFYQSVSWNKSIENSVYNIFNATNLSLHESVRTKWKPHFLQSLAPVCEVQLKMVATISFLFNRDQPVVLGTKFFHTEWLWARKKQHFINPLLPSQMLRTLQKTTSHLRSFYEKTVVDFTVCSSSTIIVMDSVEELGQWNVS